MGVVLSGGSARAFAHIGVLRSLEEQGIIPDFIVSNSMGSIVGLLYAAGLSCDQILDMVTNIPLSSLFDLTLPLRGGLLEPSRFVAKTMATLGEDLRLEELPIPILVVTEDIITRRSIRLAEGSFYDVLSASYALPVYFPPVAYGEHLLVDGGITNLAPLSVAFEYTDTAILSTTFYNAEWLNLRNPLTILNVTIDIGKRRQGITDLKTYLDRSVWIRCSVENYSFMQFSAAAELARRGYESAQAEAAALAALPRTGIPAGLAELRAVYALRIREQLRDFQHFGHIQEPGVTQLLSVSLDTYRRDDDHSWLWDGNLLGLKYLLRAGNFDFALSGGLSSYLYSADAIQSHFAASVGMGLQLSRHLRASLLGLALFDGALGKPVFYGNGLLEARLLSPRGAWRFRALAGGEFVENSGASEAMDSFDGRYWLASALLDLSRRAPERSGWHADLEYLEAGAQFLGDFSQYRPLLTARGRLSLGEGHTGLFARVGSTFRMALDGGGEVPLFRQDGFRTANAALLTQGHSLDVRINGANVLLAANALLAWRPPALKLSLAELLIIEDSWFGLWADALWPQGVGMPALSYGLELRLNVSLIGIRTLPVSAYAGWDQSVGGLIWGFWFNYGL